MLKNAAMCASFTSRRPKKNQHSPGILGWRSRVVQRARHYAPWN
ncbi:uncharacterized protein G2W53_037269 [Senna tora]|uniref:Uncharacterized protein n=1 Tax=Senna tora TaxID=362788 RepID=A0A834SWZ6_9FABA|nr:uncharacterized protein G2W53_037269 [Senna tora]